MGKLKRLHRIAVATGKAFPRSISNPNLLLLDKLVASQGSGIRDKMLEGAESSMREQVQKQLKHGIDPTVAGCTDEIAKNARFLEVCGKVGISLEDFEEIARKIINEETQSGMISAQE